MQHILSSSIYENFGPENIFLINKIYKSKLEIYPYVQIDMGSSVKILGLTILHKSNGQLSIRIGDTDVGHTKIGKKILDNTNCANVITNGESSVLSNVKCSSGIVGRYITIQLITTAQSYLIIEDIELDISFTGSEIVPPQIHYPEKPEGCIEIAKFYHGPVIGKDIETDDAFNCQLLCRENDKCEFWTFDHITKKCTSRSAKGSVSNNGRFTSGSQICNIKNAPYQAIGIADTSCFKKNKDYKTNGYNLAHFANIKTPKTCQRLCQLVSQCQLWTFYVNTCYLKTGGVALTDAKGPTSGEKYCREELLSPGNSKLYQVYFKYL